MGIGEACGIGSAAMCAKELGSHSSAFGLHWLGFGAKQCVEVELGALLIDSLHTLAHTELGKATPILQLKHPFLKFVNVK